MLLIYKILLQNIIHNSQFLEKSYARNCSLSSNNPLNYKNHEINFKLTFDSYLSNDIEDDDKINRCSHSTILKCCLFIFFRSHRFELKNAFDFLNTYKLWLKERYDKI